MTTEDVIEIEVELPTPLFQRAEELAEEMNLSRSELYTLALQDLIARMETPGHDARFDDHE